MATSEIKRPTSSMLIRKGTSIRQMSLFLPLLFKRDEITEAVITGTPLLPQILVVPKERVPTEFFHAKPVPSLMGSPNFAFNAGKTASSNGETPYIKNTNLSSTKSANMPCARHSPVAHPLDEWAATPAKVTPS